MFPPKRAVEQRCGSADGITHNRSATFYGSGSDRVGFDVVGEIQREREGGGGVREAGRGRGEVGRGVGDQITGSTCFCQKLRLLVRFSGSSRCWRCLRNVFCFRPSLLLITAMSLPLAPGFVRIKSYQ